MEKVMAITLAQFVHDQMETRHMSTREFATFCGVSQSTIVRAGNYKGDPSKMDIKSLRSIAKATEHSLIMLVGLIYPDESEIDAEALFMAETFGQLPSEDRERLSAGMLGIMSKRRNQSK